MVVYLDVIWFLNFLVDSLLLWATAIFLKRDIHAWRIILAGFLGSILILMAVTPYAHAAGHPLMKLSLSICMVLIAFGFKRFKSFITSLLTFYFATFLMGGILLGTHYFLTFNLNLRTSVALESIRGFGDPISWLFVAAAFPMAWHFSRRRVEELTISSIEYDVLMDIDIRINGLNLHLKGLIDSGNQLYDPISKTPVMVVSISTFKEQLPEEILLLANDRSNAIEMVDNIPKSWGEKMRLIPAKTLGSNHQLLCAFKPESLAIQVEEEQKIVKKALIVFTDQQLSGDGQFQCIIHPLMMEQMAAKPAS